MLKTGILNPAVLSLLARVRHTNTLVIADRGFPFWPQIETVDLSLVDDVPTVLQVLDALRPNFQIGRVFAAEEFRRSNDAARQQALISRLSGIPLLFEPPLPDELLFPLEPPLSPPLPLAGEHPKGDMRSPTVKGTSRKYDERYMRISPSGDGDTESV